MHSAVVAAVMCRSAVTLVYYIERAKDIVGATATTSRRRGRPVIDGGSRGTGGVATQVAGASYVDAGEADRHLRMRA